MTLNEFIGQRGMNQIQQIAEQTVRETAGKDAPMYRVYTWNYDSDLTLSVIAEHIPSGMRFILTRKLKIEVERDGIK